MRNFWIDRFKVGKRVRYIGLESYLCGKIGVIVRRVDHGYIDVAFEFPGLFTNVLEIAVHRENLELF